MVQEIDEDTNQYTEEYDGVATLPPSARHMRKETRTAFPSPKFANKRDKTTTINSLHESLKKSYATATDLFLDAPNVITPLMIEKQRIKEMAGKDDKPRENPTMQSIKTPVKMGISLIQA